ncbi:MAG: anthranilate synthase component I family protein [Bacteroidia bacterium]
MADKLSQIDLQKTCDEFRYVMYLNSNGYNDHFGKFESLLMAANRAHELKEFSDWDTFASQIKTGNSTRALLFSYDLKNCFEKLQSQHPKQFDFPLAGTFTPELLVENAAIAGFDANEDNSFQGDSAPEIISETSREEYHRQFEFIQGQLRKGNIYETNYCIRFSAHVPNLNPIALYYKLNRRSPSPFSALVRWNDSWLICSSPERFLCKKGNRLIAQPIKGTARRTGNAETDKKIAAALKNDAKERAENIMITDLMRNDLSHFALPGTVKVSELCGVYPYNKVFQMISTVEAHVPENCTLADILPTVFPMGSMTGVPKISAMQLADEYESFRRELYSGSIGYCNANGDFDLNVVIRSYLYNARTGVLSFSTGGAITIRSDADREYDECLLKAESLIECLK